MDKIKTSLYLPTELHDKVKAEAARRGWTVTYVVQSLLARWVEHLGTVPPRQP